LTQIRRSAGVRSQEGQKSSRLASDLDFCFSGGIPFCKAPIGVTDGAVRPCDPLEGVVGPRHLTRERMRRACTTGWVHHTERKGQYPPKKYVERERERFFEKKSVASVAYLAFKSVFRYCNSPTRGFPRGGVKNDTTWQQVCTTNRKPPLASNCFFFHSVAAGVRLSSDYTKKPPQNIHSLTHSPLGKP